MNDRKIKVTSADIIVTGTKDNPYFEIKYKEIGKNHYTIGCGSYCLDYVFQWRNEYFTIVRKENFIKVILQKIKGFLIR